MTALMQRAERAFSRASSWFSRRPRSDECVVLSERDSKRVAALLKDPPKLSKGLLKAIKASRG